MLPPLNASSFRTGLWTQNWTERDVTVCQHFGVDTNIYIYINISFYIHMNIYYGCWPSSRAKRNWRQRDALDDALMVTTTSHQVRWRCKALPQVMLICNETTTQNIWKERVHIEYMKVFNFTSIMVQQGMYRLSLLREMSKSPNFANYKNC